ncbi:MAG TPA: shikimate kinase [Burkholderiaceae bacterium]|nr:shikimate kinase [Burkholderiaceae bacterium]
MIALVGMPGSGKSTVGRHVARHLGWPFVDTDHLIEQRIGCSIREYFELHGEPAFRDVEQSVIEQVVGDSTSRVVATGGGAVLREGNRAVLHAHCAVFYLRSTPEELARRLRHDTHRPLLQGSADPLKRLRALFAERDPLYRATAHYVVETGRPSVHTLVNMVLMQVDLAGLAAGRAEPALPDGAQP